MDLFITTFEAIAALLGIGLIGFWIIQRRILPGKILEFLSPLALDIALPCLVFARILNDFTPNELADWWQMPIWWMLFTAIAACLTFIFMFISKRHTRREFAISLFYQNGIFFPLAILVGMFPGEQSTTYIVYLFFFTLLYPAFFFSTYNFFFGKINHKAIDWRKIIHPVLIVTVIAIIIKLIVTTDQIPQFIIQIFSLIGAMTIPLLFLILGGNIYIDLKKKGKWEFLEITKFVLTKNIIFPLAFIGIVILIKPAYHIALILMLQSAVPPITAVPLVTERSGGNRSIVNQFMVASFISSLITIPLMVSFFSMYYIP